ncbi:MAG TPA: AAA family ATPase [Acidimicrobiales bacterium]|nr:AAA family ATPase [Acidimicrobiales bacterium]
MIPTGRIASLDGDHDDYQPPHEEPGAASLLDGIRAQLLSGDAIENLAPPEPLVHGLLDLDSLAVVYGRPGGGKTHIAIDIALHVATGSWWHGHEVVEGHVLYIVAEGARGVGQRQRAWKSVNRYHGSLDGRITWLPVPVNLLGPDQAQAIATIAADLGAVLVVIDTLGRSMAGGDENAYRDMSLVIDAVERIRRATGACVSVVHHSGKDASAGSRGHSSLLGAVHTELEVLNGGDGIITLRTTKQKDHADTVPPWRFVLAPGAESVAIASYTGSTSPDEDLPTKTAEALEVLRSIAVPGGVTTAKWVAAADETNVSRATVYRAAKSLVDRGLVSMTGTGSTARYMPTEQDEQ